MDNSKKIRREILLLIPSLQGGGAERVVATLLRHIDRRKFNVVLAVVDMSDAVFESQIPSDIEIIDLKASRIRTVIHKIVRLAWKLKPDVIFSTLSHLNLAIAIFKPLFPRGISCIARESVVVSSLPMSYSMPFWWFWAYRRFYNRFDRVICQSIDMQHDLIHEFGLSSTKALLINNPVDVKVIRDLALQFSPRQPAIDPSKGTLNLVAAGRLVHQKGFDLLIKAISIVKNDSLHLSILGEGALRKELEDLAVMHEVSHQVSFLGFQKNPYPFFACADAFVLSSRFEGFPNVVLEALACGTPVIAMPAPGGVQEILRGMEGSIVAESITAESLAKSLVEFKPGFRVPQKAVNPYSVDSIVQQYEQVLALEKI